MGARESIIPTPLLVTVIFLIVFKVYLVVTCGVCTSKRRLTGKTVIVTGANKGLGKETARNLASRGARVILACRDLNRANAAREEIVAATSNENVVVQKLDLASLYSVRNFVERILATEERLDVLFNCAGVGGMDNDVTEDGLQIEIQTNYIGPFLLTNLLVDLLKKSSPSRVIFMSSALHRFTGRIELNNLNYVRSKKENIIDQFFRYALTKLANILNANELARRLEGTGVTVNSLHPGAVATDVFAHMPFWMYRIIRFYLECFCKSPVQGAQTGIFLAVAEEVEGVTGKYFADCKEAEMASAAQDEGLAKKLWEITEEMINRAKR